MVGDRGGDDARMLRRHWRHRRMLRRSRRPRRGMGDWVVVVMVVVVAAVATALSLTYLSIRRARSGGWTMPGATAAKRSTPTPSGYHPSWHLVICITTPLSAPLASPAAHIHHLTTS